MKKYLLALATAILIAGQFFTPAAAASSSSVTASTDCGTLYIVKNKDNLSKIAALCGTTVANILALNPQITNPNVIYKGQMLRMNVIEPSVYSLPYTGIPRVSVSSTQAVSGTALTVYVKGFPPNAPIDYRVGRQDESFYSVYDGTIDSNGESTMTVTIPYAADYGENWVILVTTTGQKEDINVYSPAIYITG